MQYPLRKRGPVSRRNCSWMAEIILNCAQGNRIAQNLKKAGSCVAPSEVCAAFTRVPTRMVVDQLSQPFCPECCNLSLSPSSALIGTNRSQSSWAAFTTVRFSCLSPVH